ncbi:MAG: chloride channel protein, partial [Alphaproteobacteria bacterium]
MRRDRRQPPACHRCGRVSLWAAGALVPAQGKQQPAPVFPRRFSRLEVEPVRLRQLQLTQLAHHPEGIGVVEYLLEGPERFAVVAHLNQPQRLWVQPEADQTLRRQPGPGGVILSDPEQRRRFIAGGLIALLFLLRIAATAATLIAGGVGGLFIPLAALGVVMGEFVGTAL